jgi:hypothetical protein
MLGTADLLGQMADRMYLEKLLLLFYEFQEGEVGDYESELDLLQKSEVFQNFIQKRLFRDFSNVSKYLRPHFVERWKQDKDLYQEAVQKNMDYLKHILQQHENEHRSWLRRGGISERLGQEGL